MKLNFVRLRNFRNIAFADVDLRADSVWIFGANAQGKTNLLEAAGMFGALRSFRTSAADALVGFGGESAEIFGEIESQTQGKCAVEISLSRQKRVLIDGQKISRLGEYLGKFPMLPITNEDLALLRGAPESRRRDADMFISSLSPEYFDALRRYHKAMAHRNALLKTGSPDAALFEAFEAEMASAAVPILKIRREIFEKLGEIASEKYAVLAAESPDRARIALKPNCDIPDAETFAETLRKNRRSDAEKRCTQRGVHRDDFKISIDAKDAKLYASEGQQKSAAIAFRLAQFELLKSALGDEPAILCDDILGELDADRRARFWQCASPTAQIIATSTEPPPRASARGWKKFMAQNGTFNECA